MSFAIAGTVLTVGATAYAANRANAAGRAGARGANNATAESARQYDQTRRDFEDWRTVGRGALAQQAALFGIPVGNGASGNYDDGQLFNDSGGVPTVDSERYANDPAYRYAWDRTLEQEKADRPGWRGQETYWARATGEDWSRLNERMARNLGDYRQRNPQQQQPQGQGGNLNGFFTSPGYQFRRDEGTRGIESSFAAGGGARSGNALAALAEFNSGLASQEFGQYFNQLSALSGAGQTATNQTAAYGADHAANAGRNALYAGESRASGIVGQANAIGQGINALGGIAGYYSRNRQPQSYGGTGYGGYPWQTPGIGDEYNRRYG